MTEKIPPQAPEAEQAVLGAMMQSGEALHLGIEKLEADQFYDPKHRKIFSAIKSLFDSSSAVDLITIPEELSRRGQLEDIGGRRLLLDLVDGIVNPANVSHYIQLVTETAIRNDLINHCNEINAKCYDRSIPIEELTEFAEQRIFSISERSARGDYKPIRQILPGAFDGMEGKSMGIPSGFSKIDDMICGFQKPDLVIIAGRPSAGKTSFALNIVEHTALADQVPVAFFSLEMSEEQLVRRLICGHAGVSFQKARRGDLTDDDYTKMSLAVGELNGARIFIDDTAAQSISEIRAKARRMKLRDNIRLVVVDYLQLVKGQKNPENRQQEITYISQSLKALAKELDLPVLALSQLSRQVELRSKDARPQLSDLRESGALEQDADVVIFIHRPRDNKGQQGNEAEIIIGKQRNGPTGILKMTFQPEFTRFREPESLDHIHHKAECVA